MGDVEGKVDQLKGHAKQAVGDLTDDQDLKDEGAVDRMVGTVKNKAGDAKDKVNGAVDKAREALEK